MKLARIATVLIAVGILAAAPPSSYAEEITLKDGQKIIGTIVGYEKDMFRIETDFGIALVRKDKVISIQVSKPDAAGPALPSPKKVEVKPAHGEESPKTLVPASPKASTASPAFAPPIAPKPTTAKPSEPPASSAKAEVSPVVTAQPLNPPSGPAPSLATTHASAPSSSIEPPAARSTSPALVAAQPVAPPPAPKPPAPPPPVSHPLDVPLPAHLQEHLEGNTYTNDTFQFSMYKPPDWKVYEGLPKETGSGIMAMGTEDEQTLVMVDRQVWSGAPNLTSSEAEAKLRQTYQEFRLISEEPFLCDGKTATRRTFTGILEGVEWHGVAVHVIQGNMVFGITGLTAAETYQFQEAIFNKIFKTLHFQAPLIPPAASAHR